MGTTPKLATARAADNRYAGALEHAPELLATLKSQSRDDFNLTSEIQLARTLLENLVAQLGGAHAKTGLINPIVVDGVQRMIGQVQSIVSTAAGIEAKRTDQRISATHILALLVGLRNDLKRRLQMAFGDTAATVVEEVFNNARWTGGLRDDDVREALLEPAAFDLRLRMVDREGDALRESAKARGLNSPELLAMAGEDEEVDAHDPLAVPADVTEATVKE